MFGRENTKRGRNIIVTCLAVVLVVFLGALFGVQRYYSNRWSPNTIVNGIDVSGQTLEESKKEFQKIEDSYSLHIKGRKDGEMTLDGKSIGLAVDYASVLDALFQHQKAESVFPNFEKEKYEEEFKVQVSKKQLQSALKQSELLSGSENYKIIKPKNAYITYSEETGCGVLIPEEMGNKIVPVKLQKVVMNAIELMDTSIDLTDESMYHDVYKNPTYTSENSILQEQMKNYNSYLLKWIEWDMPNGEKEMITPEQIKEWLSIDKKGKVKFDEQGLRDWVEAFCLKYKTYGATRTFTTHDNQKIQVTGGDYGWRMDYEGTINQALKEIKKKKYKADEAYAQDPSDENKKPLTTSLEPQFTKKAFRMNSENPTMDWDPNNYSEVDISDQMVYVYKDGKLAYSSICVTGLISDPERATKLGCYDIKDKKEDYVLKGADYETPTKYWVRIMWTGTGYHYLGRSDWGRWSPEIYKSRGSHGCINLQLEDARSIYNLVNMHDAVFIHN